MVKIAIYTDFITLGQFLKLAGLINNGGEAKFYLQNVDVLVCGEVENRRGRKLRIGDLIEVNGRKFEIVQKNEN